jgi:hypothetical protein
VLYLYLSEYIHGRKKNQSTYYCFFQHGYSDIG